MITVEGITFAKSMLHPKIYPLSFPKLSTIVIFQSPLKSHPTNPAKDSTGK